MRFPRSITKSIYQVRCMFLTGMFLNHEVACAEAILPHSLPFWPSVFAHISLVRGDGLFTYLLMFTILIILHLSALWVAERFSSCDLNPVTNLSLCYVLSPATLFMEIDLPGGTGSCFTRDKKKLLTLATTLSYSLASQSTPLAP